MNSTMGVPFYGYSNQNTPPKPYSNYVSEQHHGSSYYFPLPPSLQGFPGARFRLLASGLRFRWCSLRFFWYVRVSGFARFGNVLQQLDSRVLRFRIRGFIRGTEELFFSLTCTHRLHSSSFSGLPYRVLDINHKKELRTMEPMGSHKSL